MISYVHARVWSLHATLLAENLDEGLAAARPFSLAEVAGDEKLDGALVVSRRIGGEDVDGGHDVYPAIDIRADPTAVEALQDPCFGRQQALRLADLLLRLDDMGFLQVVAVFDVTKKGCTPREIEMAGVEVARGLNGLVAQVEPILGELEQIGLLQLSRDLHFGVPSMLEGHPGFDRTDTYLYSDHVLLVEEPPEVIETFLSGAHDEAPLCLGDVEVHTPWASPVWLSPRSVDLEGWLYLLAAERLLLSEELCYAVGIQCYQVLLETFFATDRSRGRRATAPPARPRRVGGGRWRRRGALSSKELLRLMIRANLPIQKVHTRRAVLDNSQGNYLHRSREKQGLDESLRAFREAERVLGMAVQERESEEKDRANTVIESTLFFFTGLTLYSVIVDLSSFLRQGEATAYDLSLGSPRVHLVVVATCLIALLFLLLRRMRRR